MRAVAHADVGRLLRGGARVVEVLPADEYHWAHLPGALHVPLAELHEFAPRHLAPHDPVVVYCNDFL